MLEQVFHDSSVVPADLLAMIKKEEQQARFNKCRELNLELTTNNSTEQGADEDLLKLIGGGAACTNNDSRNHSVESNHDQTYSTSRVSLGIMPMGNMSQEVFKKRYNLNKVKVIDMITDESILFKALEDLTCALLKSFPQSEHQLEVTIRRCRNLVFSKFPKIFQTDGPANNNSKVANAEYGRKDYISGHQYNDFQVQIPDELLFKSDLGANSLVESEQTDLVEELFKLQNELEKKRTQCHMILNEFEKIK